MEKWTKKIPCVGAAKTHYFFLLPDDQRLEQLRIKTVSDSPEIRNLSDEEADAALKAQQAAINAAAAAGGGSVYNPDDPDGSATAAAAAHLAATKLLELSNSHPIPYSNLVSTAADPPATEAGTAVQGGMTINNPANNNNNSSSTSKSSSSVP